VCLSRVANVLGGGFNIIITNAIIADLFGGSSASSANSSSSGSTTTGGGAQAQQGMGAALGTQAAYASLGFLLGSLIGGRLTEIGERWAYGACSLLSCMAMSNVVFRMTESLDYDGGGGYHNSRRLNSNENDKNNIQQQHCDEQGLMPTASSSSSSSSSSSNNNLSLLMTKFIEAPLSSIRLLYNYGPKMRTLATLLILQSIPMFMGGK
jgi:MFS family permease